MRVFITSTLQPKQRLHLTDDFHHIVDVMRKRNGDFIECVNNGVWRCKIVEIGKKSLTIECISLIEEGSDNRSYKLAFGNIRQNRAELIIEKCTEIGITDFYPLIAERTQVHNFAFDRCERLLKSAAEQSMKLRLPQIHQMQSLSDLQIDSTWAIASCTSKDSELRKEITNILIGPEGGWSSAEEGYCIEQGAQPISLGNYILRAETACIVGAFKIINS